MHVIRDKLKDHYQEEKLIPDLAQLHIHVNAVFYGPDHLRLPTRTVLIALAYISQATPTKGQFGESDPCYGLLAGALLFSAKVYPPFGSRALSDSNVHRILTIRQIGRNVGINASMVLAAT